VAGAQPGSNPRFPEGLKYLFRSSRIDVTIPDEGVPTMALTLNTLPSTIPLQPPVSTEEYIPPPEEYIAVEEGREEREAEEKEAKEREEKEAKEREEKEAKEREEKEAKEKAEKEAKEKSEKEAKEKEEAENLLGEGVIDFMATCVAQTEPVTPNGYLASSILVETGASQNQVRSENTLLATYVSVTPPIPAGTKTLSLVQTSGDEIELIFELPYSAAYTNLAMPTLGNSVEATWTYKAFK